MPYIQLAAAIVLELCGTTFLKMSEGFTKLGPSVLCMVLYFFCFFIFSKALVHLNLGVAYATWSGVGLVVTAIISAVLFGQRLSLCALESFRHRAVNGVFSAGLRACCFL